MGIVKESDFLSTNEAETYGVLVSSTTEKEKSQCERFISIDEEVLVTCICPQLSKPKPATDKFIGSLFKK